MRSGAGCSCTASTWSPSAAAARCRPAPREPVRRPARGPRLAFVLSPTAVRSGAPVHRRGRGDAGAASASTSCAWGSSGKVSSPGRWASDRTIRATAPPTRPARRSRSSDRLTRYNAAVLNAYLARTDRIVALLAHAGIRVVLDMHQDAWGSAFSNRASPAPWNGEGAPPWATCTNGHKFERAAAVVKRLLRSGRHGRRAQLLRQRRARRPAGPVRPRLAGGRERTTATTRT